MVSKKFRVAGVSPCSWLHAVTLCKGYLRKGSCTFSSIGSPSLRNRTSTIESVIDTAASMNSEIDEIYVNAGKL